SVFGLAADVDPNRKIAGDTFLPRLLADINGMNKANVTRFLLVRLVPFFHSKMQCCEHLAGQPRTGSSLYIKGLGLCGIKNNGRYTNTRIAFLACGGDARGRFEGGAKGFE